MEEQRSNSYVLSKFVETQNYEIGTLDPIATPKTFQKKSFLNEMKDVIKFISEKPQFGVRYVSFKYWNNECTIIKWNFFYF